MIYDYRLHGVLGAVEFFAYVFGPEAKNSLFYEESSSMIRFFSRGNEFTIEENRVHYRGTGGHFCEYMFGVDKPLKDMLRRDVRNRLIMFGAVQSDDGGITFTDNIEGSEAVNEIFLHGNAVKNYYFFVSSDFRGRYAFRQQEILGAVGRFLKRTPLLTEGRDTDLILELYRALNEPDSTILLFSLSHKGNEQFYRSFSMIYDRSRDISKEDMMEIARMAAELNVDYYQQERMKIDVMYRHPENRAIVDEYHDILISSFFSETVSPSEMARLRRLRMLRIRNNIPSVLFETLDSTLLKGKKIQEEEIPEYLKEARAILENVFFRDPLLKSHIIGDDIVKLVRAKHTAYINGEREFENILLDIGKACDEYAREHGDFSLLEDFSSIISYFDRYDHVQASVSRIAFMENLEIGEDLIRSLMENRKEFNSLREGLFEEIFIRDLLNNRYITNFGRKKIKALAEGLPRIISGDSSIGDLIGRLGDIAREERLYRLACSIIKGNIRGIYSQLDSPGIRDEILEFIRKEFRKRGIKGDLPAPVFSRAILDLKKEHFYLERLLPRIIKMRDHRLREDFFTNSGLDRFYIESLEREYVKENGIDISLLEGLRQ